MLPLSFKGGRWVRIVCLQTSVVLSMAVADLLHCKDVWSNLWQYLSFSSRKRLIASCCEIVAVIQGHSRAWPPIGFTDSESEAPPYSS